MSSHTREIFTFVMALELRPSFLSRGPRVPMSLCVCE